MTNTQWDPLGRNQLGWRWYAEDIRRPALWDLAAAKGLVTAIIAWPVTVGVKAAALIPEYARAGTPDDVKLLRALSTPGLLDRVAARFPDFSSGITPPINKSPALADAGIFTLESLKPDLLLLHFEELDHQEHATGPFSPESCRALEEIDGQLARLVQAAQKAGFWEDTALLVVSDHGFAPVTWAIRPGVYLRKAGLISFVEGTGPGAGESTAEAASS